MMSDIEPILQRFLENRENLSEAEFERLLEAMRNDPRVAERVKDHLILDELLAQQSTPSRGDFVALFEQRLQEENPLPGVSSSKSSTASNSETYHLRWSERSGSNGDGAIASSNGSSPTHSAEEPDLQAQPVPAKNPTENAKPGWGTFAAVAVPLLLAIAGLLWMEFQPAARKIASVESVHGMVVIHRQGVGIVAATEMLILPGDQIEVKSNAEISIAYPDKTQVRLSSQTVAVFQPGTENHPGLMAVDLPKEVFISRGELTANVTPQPPGRPMFLKTRQVEAEVLGTRLVVHVEEHQSRVEVLEGLVAVKATQQDAPPVELSSGQEIVANQTEFRVSPGAWPVNPLGLEFLLDPKEAKLSHSPNSGVQLLAMGPNQSPRVLRPRHNVTFENGQMIFRAGAFLGDDPTATALLSACQKSGQISLEATVQTQELSQTGPARWITFSTHSHDGNFSLAQEDRHCVLRLLTFTKEQGELRNEIPLFQIPDLEPHHVVVTYKSGELRCYLDGKAVAVPAKIQGDFSHWKPQHFLFGDEWNGEREWKGQLAGVAIYHRALSPEEAARNAMHYRLRYQQPIPKANTEP